MIKIISEKLSRLMPRVSFLMNFFLISLTFLQRIKSMIPLTIDNTLNLT